MQHIVVHLQAGSLVIAVDDLEGRLAGRAIDRDQVLRHAQFDTVAGDHPAQSFRKKGYAEDSRRRGVKTDVTGLQHPLSAKVVCRQIRDFLRRTGAFKGHRRLCENGARTRFQPLNAGPGIRRVIRRIVAADAVAPECSRQSLNLRPVEDKTGTHDEMPVPDHVAGSEGDLIGVRLETGHGIPDQADPRRNQAGHIPSGPLQRIRPGADKCPCRLVVVGFCRVDNRDIQRFRRSAAQAGGDCDTGSPAADNNDIMLAVSHLCLQTDR